MKKRYYDYDTLVGAMHDVVLENGAKHRCIDAGMILDLSTADVVEVKYAYNETFSEETSPLFTCSECGYEEFEDNQHFRYCPHCGRKIRRKNEI